MSDWRIKILALENGAAKTGLTLADFEVDIFRVVKATGAATQVVTDDAMDSEIGGGFYLYTLADVDWQTYDYTATVTYTGSEVLDSDLWQGEGDDEVSTKMSIGDGRVTYEYTVTHPTTGLPIADVDVIVSTDADRANIIARDFTDESGVATFHLSAGSYYFWPRKAGVRFTEYPDYEEVTE